MNNENPFRNIKVRGLFISSFLLFSVGIFVLAAAEIFFNINFSEAKNQLYVRMILYILLGFWIRGELLELNISLKRIIGSIPSSFKLHKFIIYCFLSITLMLGLIWLTFYCASFAFPSSMENILNENTSVTSDKSFSLIDNLLSLILIILIAPIMEELVFRGILLNRWTAKWSIGKAIILSSFIFGALHADILGHFAVGIILSLLYIKTQSLVAPILFHMLNNTFAAIADLYDFYNTGDEIIHVSVNEFQSDSFWFGIICLSISLPWFIYFIKNNWPRKGCESSYTKMYL